MHLSVVPFFLSIFLSLLVSIFVSSCLSFFLSIFLSFLLSIFFTLYHSQYFLIYFFFYAYFAITYHFTFLIFICIYFFTFYLYHQRYPIRSISCLEESSVLCSNARSPTQISWENINSGPKYFFRCVKLREQEHVSIFYKYEFMPAFSQFFYPF